MPYSHQAPVTPVKSYYQPFLEGHKNSPKIYYASYNTAADSSNKKKNVYYEDEENVSQILTPIKPITLNKNAQVSYFGEDLPQ